MRCVRRWFSLGLALLMVPMGVPQAIAQEPSFPAPAAFVPAMGLGAIVIRPQSVISYPEYTPEMRMLPVEVIEALGEEYLGINPLALAEIKVIFGMPMGPAPPPVGLVFTTIDDFDPAKMSPELLVPGGPRNIDGRKAYQLAIPDANLEVMIVMVNSKTGLIGDPLMLQAMQGSAEGVGPLAELLKKNAIGSANFQAAIAVQPLRPLLSGFAENPPGELPVEVRDLIRSTTLIHSVVWRLKADNGSMISRYEILADDAAGATKLFQASEKAIDYGRAELMAELAKLADDMEPGPVTDAVVAYSRRISDEIITSLRPKLRGDRLVIDYRSSVSMATIPILVGLLWPAVQAAREAARRMSSSNNLKQIALAMHNYDEAYRHLPDAAIRNAEGEPLLSWRVAILPFIEEQELYERFRKDEPWDSPHNIALLEEMPDVFASPGMPLMPGHTVYHAAVGEGMAFSPTELSRFQQFTDGLSNTIMVLEGNAASQVPWTSPDYLEIDPEDPLEHFRGARPVGFQAAIADGSVQFISSEVDEEVFRALLTRSGGEEVRLP